MAQPKAQRGGCLCGALRYRVLGKPKNTMVCHCESCRRACGAPVVAWLTFDAARFRWTKGKMSDNVRWVRFGDRLPAFPRFRPAR